MEFAGVSREDSHTSTLSDEVAVPVRWPEESYVESLMKINQSKTKEQAKGRDRLDFVPETKSRSGASSASGTPGEAKRSRFDKR